MSNIISFTNAVASIKEGAVIDEARLRDTTVYAKLMLTSGTKFGTVVDRHQFLLSEAGNHIRAELFYLNKRNQQVFDQRLFVNVSIDAKILCDATTKMYYVELEHPTVDLANAVEVEF
jgi:hypothetical protein